MYKQKYIFLIPLAVSPVPETDILYTIKYFAKYIHNF